MFLKTFLCFALATAGSYGRSPIDKRIPYNHCKENLILGLQVRMDMLEGTWFKIAHKPHPQMDSLSTVMQVTKVSATKATVVEYSETPSNGECRGPNNGELTIGEQLLTIKFGGEDGKPEMSVSAKVVYHYKRTRIPAEEMISLYACGEAEADGSCSPANQLAGIYSRNRRPATRVLFDAAKALERICINPRTLRKLNTLTECGDEIVPAEQKYPRPAPEYESRSEPEPEGEPEGHHHSHHEHAGHPEGEPEGHHAGHHGAHPEGEPEGEPMAEVEAAPEAESKPHHHHHHHPSGCKVRHVKGVVLDESKLEPGHWYLIAALDKWILDEGITFASSSYRGEKQGYSYKTYMNFVRHGICLSADVVESPLGRSLTSWKSKSEHRKNGQLQEFEWKNKLVYNDGDAYLTYWCDRIKEDGTCKQPRVNLWSKSRQIRHGELQLIYAKLMELCVNPMTLTYMSTEAQCWDPVPVNSETPRREHSSDHSTTNKCEYSNVHHVQNFNSFEGWNGTSYLVSIVTSIEYLSTVTAGVSQMTVEGSTAVGMSYIQTGFGCLGPTPFEMAQANPDGGPIQLTVTTENGTFPGGEFYVLHDGTGMLLLYGCGEIADDGTCNKPEVRVMSRTREFRHTDHKRVVEHLKAVCVNNNQLKWLDTHSHCGEELDVPFPQQRHNYLAMSHTDVLDVVTKYARTTCKVSEFKGQYVCLKAFSKHGPYFVHAIHEPGVKAMYGKFQYEEEQNAVGLVTVASDGGMECSTAKFILSKKDAANETYYRMKIEHEGQTKIAIVRFLWANHKLAVLYGCTQIMPNGNCHPDFNIFYVMSSHEAIDHAELLVLENLARAVCVDPQKLTHLTTHHHCLEKPRMSRKMFNVPLTCAFDWDAFIGEEFENDELVGTYYMVAAASELPLPTAETFEISQVDGALQMHVDQQWKAGCKTYEAALSPVAETNGFSGEFNGTTVSFYFGPKFGSLRVAVGCLGSVDCDDDNGYVSIFSKYHKDDPVALHKTFGWLVDHCISPNWLQRMPVHHSCGRGAHGHTPEEAASCQVANIRGLTDYNAQQHDGEWHLIAQTNRHYTGGQCNVTSKSSSRKLFTCTMMSGAGQCEGPFSFDFIVPHVFPGQFHNPNTTDGQSTLPSNSTLLYQDPEHMLFYGCAKQAADGSCLADQTIAMLSSKHESIEHDSLPQGVITALENACIDPSELSYYEGSYCSH